MKSKLLTLLALLLGVTLWMVLAGGDPEMPRHPLGGSQQDEVEGYGPLDGQGVGAREDARSAGPKGSEPVRQAVALVPEDEPVPTARPEVWIEGRVTDRLAAPVEGAEVSLTLIRRDRPDSRTRFPEPVLTREDGVFAFHGRGFRDLEVSLEVRHAETALTVHRDSFQAVEPGQKLDLGDIQVVVGGTLIGSVTDQAGMAVPGATVRLHPQDAALREDPRRWRIFPRVAASSGGEFRVDHVPPGRYRLDAAAPQKERHYTDVITIADGELVRLDPIELGSRFLLAGRVLDPDGGPIAGAAVSLLRARGGDRRSTETGPEGRFEFHHLPDDLCSVSVEAEGYLRESRHGIPIAESPALDITLTPGLRIAGVVRDGVTGRTLDFYAARARLLDGLEDRAASRMRREFYELVDRLEQERNGLEGSEREEFESEMERQVREAARQLRAQGVEVDTGGRPSEEQERERRDDPDPGPGPIHPWDDQPGDAGEPEHHEGGRFELGGLAEGVYVVDISAPGHQRLRSQAVEVRRGSSAPELSITLERGLVVAGRVVDKATGEPLRDARVDLMFPRPPRPEGARLSPRRALRARLGTPGPRAIHFLHTHTDESGGFRIEQAAAGRYLLRGRARGHACAFSDPFALTRDAEGFELALGRLGVIHGRVDGVALHELESARVVITDLRENKVVKVRPDMTYRAEDLQPGSYLVRGCIGSYDRYERVWLRRLEQLGADAEGVPDVELDEGAEVRFDVRVEPEPVGDVVGQVLVDGVGRHAHGFRVRLREILDGVADAPAGRMPGRYDAFVDQNGDYAIRDVPEGRYRISVRYEGPGGREVEALRREIHVYADSRNRSPPIELMRGDLERARH